jgi:hypothetical protein
MRIFFLNLQEAVRLLVSYREEYDGSKVSYLKAKNDFKKAFSVFARLKK